MSMGQRHLVVAGLLLFGAACSSSIIAEVDPPATVKLAVGGRATIKGTSWTMVFDSVVSDSRCPIGAVCIWEGEALLALELTNPLVDPLPGDGPWFTVGNAPTIKYGFRFTTIEVKPPTRIGETIDRRSYKVTLKVEVVGGS